MGTDEGTQGNTICGQRDAQPCPGNQGVVGSCSQGDGEARSGKRSLQDLTVRPGLGYTGLSKLPGLCASGPGDSGQDGGQSWSEAEELNFPQKEDGHPTTGEECR